MPLITNRDLLIIEPAVFIDAPSSAHVLAHSTQASIADTTATFEDLDLESLNIGAGNVAVIAGVPIEIVERTSSTECEISLPRADSSDEKIPPGDQEQVNATVLTFDVLIAQIESAVLRLLGIDPQHPERPLAAEAILNPDSIKHLIAMRVLAEAFSAAAAGDPENSTLAARRDHYRNRAASALRSAACLIDIDGDGVADADRRPGIIEFTRR
jgi:hypothetical protein